MSDNNTPLQDALRARGLNESRIAAAAVLLGDSVEYDAAGKPVNLDAAITAAKARYSSEPFEGDTANLSPEQIEAAKLCGMTPDEYVNYSRGRVGAEAGVRVEVFQVVGEESGGWFHDGHVPDLGSLAVDRHGHWVGGADVCDVEVAELLNAGGCVVGQGEQDGVPDGTAAGGARLGEECFDLVCCQVPELRVWGVLLPDREDLGDLLEVVRLLDGGVAAERLDHSEALVAGCCRAAPLGLQPVQEPQHSRPVDVGQAQLLRRYPLRVFEPGEQQFDRVPVGGDGPRRGCALPGQVVDEESGQPASREVFWACALRGHDWTSSAAGIT